MVEERIHVLRSEKMAYWRNLSDEWERSHLTQRAFCELKNIRVKSFVKWRHKVRQDKAPKEIQNDQPRFLPAQINLSGDDPAPYQGALLKLANGASLQISPNIDQLFLTRLFRLLGVLAC